jgi:CRP/FNR family transcriptional regulator, cyclic AMP receptor protein
MLSLTRKRKAPRGPQGLANVPLFSGLDAKEHRVVAGLLHERRYEQGEVIFDQGEDSQALYVVISGKVLICRQGEAETGKIAEIGPGRAFGELSILGGYGRSAQARAAQVCVLQTLSRRDFEGLAESHKAIALKITLQIARQLARQLREQTGVISELPL